MASSSSFGAAHGGTAEVRPLTRMTDQMLAVLSVLLGSDSGKGQYGQGIANATALRTGTVYPILIRFERAGWVTSQWENRDDPSETRDSGAPRKYYTLTSEGRERARVALDARREALAKAGLSLPLALPPGSVFGQ
jgi:PadR family transcriptional regulator